MNGRDFTALRLSVRADLFGIVSRFCATHDIRHYLSGVLIERAKTRKGVYLVATDGARLAAAYDETGELHGDTGMDVIVRTNKGLGKAVRAASRGAMVLKMRVIGTSKRVCVAPSWGDVGSDYERFVAPGMPYIEADYPKWRNVLPDFASLKPGIQSSMFNTEYLQSISAAATQGNQSVRWWQSNSSSTIVAQFVHRPELVALLMPLRDDGFGRDEAGAWEKRLVGDSIAWAEEKVAWVAETAKAKGKVPA